MDRRSVLTMLAGAAVAATGLGRVLVAGRRPDVGPPSAGPPTAAPRLASSAPGPGAPTATMPSTAPSPAATAPAAPLVVEVLCRDAWRAAPPQGPLASHRIERVTLHHTAVPLHDDRQAPARLRQHQRYHQEVGWADIAYHLAVDRRGHVYELRTTQAPGDTFTDYDPTGHLLIVVEGDYSQQAPTDAQLEAIARLVAWAAEAFGVEVDGLVGHRDVAATSCPGDHLQAAVPELRQRAARRRAAGIRRRDVCGQDGAAAVAAIEAGRD